MKLLRAASERLGIPRLAEHPRTLLVMLLESSGCDTSRCMALMCACEDENIQRMAELWSKLTDEEQKVATIDNLAHALEIRIIDILPVISKEIVRIGKIEADIRAGMSACRLVEDAVKQALKEGNKAAFKYNEMVLKVAKIVPVPRNSVQINTGDIDARDQRQLNQAIIPTIEEVTRSVEEKKPIPGREMPLLKD